VRKTERATLLVVVPRLTQRIGFPPIGERWKETMVQVGELVSGEGLRDIFTGSELSVRDGAFPMAKALQTLPVAVFLAP